MKPPTRSWPSDSALAAVTRWCRGIGALAWLVLAVGAQDRAGSAGGREFDDLDALSLEELMQVEVTVVTHQEIRVGSAPAALFVITRQDIRRSGLTSVPELLRLVPGMHVARLDSNRWAIGARMSVGEFTNKLLVLIDGRSVYTPLFGGVHWDVQDLNVEDVERIEVIRGPGGARWGANAVNGVINVITRHSSDTRGGLVQTTAGSNDRVIGTVRYGDALDESTTWRVYARYFERDAHVDAAGDRADDGGDLGRVGLRVDGRDAAGDDLWTLQGDAYRGGSKMLATYPLEVAPYSETVPIEMPVTGGFLLGKWTPRWLDGHRTEVQAYVDVHQRDWRGLAAESRQAYDLELQHALPAWAGNRVTLGAGYRRVRLSSDPTTRVMQQSHHHGLDVFSAFVEDEIRLADDLTAYLGVKAEHNDFTGWELQPDARLSWRAGERTTVWGSVSRAVHTPTLVDYDFQAAMSAQAGPGGLPQVAFLTGSRDIGAEELWAYEVGLRTHVTESAFFDLTGFYADYDDMISYRMGSPYVDPSRPRIVVPLVAANDRYAEAYGLELASILEPSRVWTLSWSYSFLRVHGGNDEPTAVPLILGDEDLAPRHQAQLHSHHELGNGWSADVHAYFYDELKSIGIDDRLRLDLHLGWAPDDRTRLDLALQDLLDDRHPEFTREFYGHTTEVQRAVSFTATHRF